MLSNSLVSGSVTDVWVCVCIFFVLGVLWNYVQSTYCNNMHEFCAASGRMTYVVNLDPAAEHFDYPVAFGMFLFRHGS